MVSRDFGFNQIIYLLCLSVCRGAEPGVHPRGGGPVAAPLQRGVRGGRRRAAAAAAPAGAARAPRPPAAAAGQVVPLGSEERRPGSQRNTKTRPPLLGIAGEKEALQCSS